MSVSLRPLRRTARCNSSGCTTAPGSSLRHMTCASSVAFPNLGNVTKYFDMPNLDNVTKYFVKLNLGNVTKNFVKPNLGKVIKYFVTPH